MRKPTRKFLKAQLKLPLSRRFSRPPKISRDYVIVRVEDQLVLGFRAGQSVRQAMMFFERDYKRQFRGEVLPDITAIEKNAFHPDFREKINAGRTHVYDIPRAS